MDDCIHFPDDHASASRCELCRRERDRRAAGRLHADPYRPVFAALVVGPEEPPAAPAPRRPYCAVCTGTQQPHKGQRMWVRLPRTRDGFAGKGECARFGDERLRPHEDCLQTAPPSWDGPLVEVTRPFRATHRTHRGRLIDFDSELGDPVCDHHCHSAACAHCRGDAAAGPERVVGNGRSRRGEPAGSESLFLRPSPRQAAVAELLFYGQLLDGVEALL